MYTIQPGTSLQCHYSKPHTWVYVCLVVPCHLHLWQNDRDLFRATSVTRGLNGHRNKSQHRMLTMEKKVLPPLLPGLEPETFRSRVRRSNAELSPLPRLVTQHRWYVSGSWRLLCSALFKFKVTAIVQSVTECLSGQYVLYKLYLCSQM